VRSVGGAARSPGRDRPLRVVRDLAQTARPGKSGATAGPPEPVQEVVEQRQDRYLT
jgi:hypothetical protein